MIDLDELERLHAAATGPAMTLTVRTNGLSILTADGSVVFEDCGSYPKLSDDARALVSAHNALPGVIAELKTLREVMAVLDRDGGHAQEASTPEQTKERALTAIYALREVAEAAREHEEMDQPGMTTLRDHARDALRAALAKVPT
jgi:hypothetical protein